jgi:hypothetical protein
MLLKVKPLIFRKRQSVSRRRSRATPTPPVGALALVGAVVQTHSLYSEVVLVLYYTTPAYPLGEVGGADPMKWTCRIDVIFYGGVAIEAVDYRTLRVAFAFIAPEGGPDVIAYSNDPSDVSDSSGRALAAFEGFPL